MTKPTIKSARMEALEELSSIVERRLKNAGPAGLSTHEAAEGLGFALNTVRARLEEIQKAGRAYREKHTQPGRTAVYYTWHSTDPVISDDAADAPRRVSSRTYPPIGRRDELVAALFGQAGGSTHA